MKNTIYAVMTLMMLMTSCNEEYPLEGLEYPVCDEKMVLQGYIFADGGVEATVSRTIPFSQIKEKYYGFEEYEDNGPDASIADAQLYLCEDGKEVIEVPRVDGVNYSLEAGAWNMAPDRKYSLKVVSQSFGTASSEPYEMPSLVGFKNVEVSRLMYWYTECSVSFENDEPDQRYRVKISKYNSGMELTMPVIRDLMSYGELGDENSSSFYLDECDSVHVELWHFDNRYGPFMDARNQYVMAFVDESAEKFTAPEGNVDTTFGMVVNVSRVKTSLKIPERDPEMDDGYGGY